MSVLPNETDWYQLEIDQTFKLLMANGTGLTSNEAEARLERYGYNELKFKKRSPLVRFLLQFHNPLIYVLLVAGTITGVLSLRGEDMVGDTAVIFGVVILNVIIGFVQEGKGEAAIEALQRMMVLESTVLRDGKKQVKPARELVPGDVVLLEGGDKVPADLRLFNVKNLYMDEAALTGESVPIRAIDSSITRPNLPPGDQRCMAFGGTFATQGRGTGIVVTTGEHTEFGRIAKLMKETRTITTPLMRKIAAFTRFLIFAVLALAAINFSLAVIFEYGLIYSFLASVSLAVAAIPEMLPAIVAAILALAAVAMSKRNAIIKRLPAAETLGATTVICSDKTGTLTKNQMTVVDIYSGGKHYKVSGVGY
jgi:magnesium-transporting ATPase (P-type)